jgi:hypothetical protein
MKRRQKKNLNAKLDSLIGETVRVSFYLLAKISQLIYEDIESYHVIL